MLSIVFEREHLSSKVESLDKISAKLQIRAPTLDVLNVPNAKYLAHLTHQTPKNTKYQMF